MLQRVDAVRRRTGDHWINGHWATELPPHMRNYGTPRSHSPAGGSATGEDGEAVDTTPRASTLSAEPGAMFAESTSKGRARRLAAKLAHIRNFAALPSPA